MADFFIDNKKPQEPKKTKRQIDQEAYEKVCERMAQLREMRKNKQSAPKEDKQEKPKKKEKDIKIVEKEVIKEVIKEVPVERIVEKVIEKPVEIIKEIVKEAPGKPKPSSLFLDEDEIFSHIKEIKSLVSELRSQKQEQKQETKTPDPPKTAQTESTPVSEKYIFSGVRKGFRRIY